MKLTTKGRYAVTAMMDLAMHAKLDCVRLAEVAERQNISFSYLEQLFRSLKRAGLVTSVRGAKGGYMLAKADKDISLADILVAADEQINLACGGRNCSADNQCLTHGLWTQLSQQFYDFLDSKNLNELVKSRDVQTMATMQDVSQIGNIPVQFSK